MSALSKELNAVLRQQAATADVLKVISRSAFDLGVVLDTVTASASALCEADQRILFLLEGDAFHAHSVYPAEPEFLEFLRANPRRLSDKSLAPRVARSGKIEHIPDKMLDPDYQTIPGATQFSDTRTLLGIPLLQEDKVAGVFTLMRFRQSPFTERHINLVQTFADQAVIAIENVRKTRDLEEAPKQQTATADVLKIISGSAFNLKAVLPTLIDSAVRLCATNGVIYLRHGDVFVAEAAFDAGPGHVQVKMRPPRKIDRSSVSGRVALSGGVEQILDNLVSEFARENSRHFRCPAAQRP